MLSATKAEAARALAECIETLYGVEHEPVVEIPPHRELGDLAFPAALHLARQLRRNPREIATEIAERFSPPAGVSQVRVEGAGYLNLFLDRSALGRRAC